MIPLHPSFWSRLQITKLATDLGFKELRDSPQWQCLHSGGHMAGLCMKHRPASINPAPGSHEPSGPTTVQTDYQGSFYIISPTPLALYPTFWWPTRLGRPLLKCLGQPRTHHHLEPHKHQQFDPVHWEAVEATCREDKMQLKTRPLMREVSIGACDWANWNQHPWLDTQARALGSVSHANISHCSHCPAGSEGSPLRSGRGRMPVMGVQREAS